MNDQPPVQVSTVCPQCEGKRSFFQCGPEMYVIIPWRILPYRDAFSALICESCGYTSFYVNDPSDFRRKQK